MEAAEDALSWLLNVAPQMILPPESPNYDLVQAMWGLILFVLFISILALFPFGRTRSWWRRKRA